MFKVQVVFENFRFRSHFEAKFGRFTSFKVINGIPIHFSSFQLIFDPFRTLSKTTL